MGDIFFWIIVIALTAVVTATVLWPIMRRREAVAPARAEYDLEVFGAQLSELKADVERGTIAPEDGVIARAEIGRRLLKATSEAGAAKSTAPRAGRAWLLASVVFALLALPAASIGLYWVYGSPDMPDLPLVARLSVDPAKADLPTLVAQAEARLRQKPDDGAGWDRLAPVYLRSGRPDDAVTAFGNAMRLLGATPEREAGLGEALTQVASGEVTDEARAHFERALALNADYLPAQFFLALDLSQEDRFKEAAPAWQALIAASPQGAPWLRLANLALQDARTKIAAAGGGNGAEVANAPAAPGPTGADMAAASEMAPADRQAMIEGMVSQLAERLKTAPNDVEGWTRLMRSYSVMGKPGEANAAFASASALFAPGTAERGAIDAAAANLGLTAQGPTTQGPITQGPITQGPITQGETTAP